MAEENPFAQFVATDDNPFTQFVKPETDPGYFGEAARALKHGALVTVPKAIGNSLKFAGTDETGQGIVDAADQRDTPDLQESTVGKKARDDRWWGVRGNVASAADNAVLSMAPGAAGAAIGAAVGAFTGPGAAVTALIGYGIGSIAALPIFYGSQAQESYEAVMKHQRELGTPEDEAQRIASRTAHIEGTWEAGGELAQDVIPFAKLFKPFGKVATKAVVSSVLKPTLKGAAATVGEVVGGEVATEMAQQAGEDWTRKAVGDTGEGATWDETKKVIVPTALMSVFPGGAGAGAHHYKRTVALNALSSPETDPEMRARIAVGAAAAMADGNEDVARAFSKYAGDQIANKAPIEINDDDQFYLQYKLQTATSGAEASAAAEAALSAPVDAVAPVLNDWQSNFNANRVPADSAVTPIGVDLQGPPAQTPAIALPTDTAPATEQIVGPLSLTSEQIVATADRLTGMPVGAQTQELLALDRPTRQAVVQAMQPSGLVVPDAGVRPGMGEAARITNDATTAASSVQPMAGDAVTNRPMYTHRAATEMVRVDPTQEMRPYPGVPNRFEVVPKMNEPAATQVSLVPKTLDVPVTQQQLAEQESPATPAVRPVVPSAPLAPWQTALNQQAADAERSSLPRKSVFRNSQLRSESGPDIKGEKVTRNMRRFLSQIGKLTGTKVVFEYAPGDADGSVAVRGEGTIHINTAAQINPLEVMGHELTHVLRHRHGEAWGAMRDALVATMPDKRKALEEFAKNYWWEDEGKKDPHGRLAAALAMPDWSQKLTPEQRVFFNSNENTIEAFLLDEMVSDLGGKHWATEQFYTDTFAKIEAQYGSEKAKGIIQRLVAAIKEAVAKFLMVVRAQKQDEFVTVTPEQLEATRDAVTSAYAKLINEARTSPQEHPVTDRRISTSDITSRSQGSEVAPERKQDTPTPARKPATDSGDELADARAAELASLSPNRPDQRLFFEVAPNPNDAAATAAWNVKTDAEKQTVSNDVVKRIIPGLLSDIGVTGKVVTQLGGWKQHTNPSFALVVSRGDPALAARAIGYVLDQEAVYALGLKSFTGGEKTGIIHFDIGRKDAHNIYKQVRDLARGIITGHSTVGGEMLIGLPMADMQRLRSAVEAVARKADIAVNFDSGYGAIIKEYGYGIQFGQQNSRQQHPTARDVNQWRTEAREAFGSDRSDAAGSGSDRTVSRSEVRPSYGKAIDQHAGTVTGVHYSTAKREALNSEFYGTGYRGAERARLAGATDTRIKRRVYFYINNGSGINPESGVGYHAHSVDLRNMYNGDSDPLNLADRDSNKFESNVIDAGYDGYYTRNFGKSGAAVLLGAHAVPVRYEGLGARPDVPMQRSETRPPSWWYSPLARQAETATMKKAPASGWKSWLKSLAAKGVKPDEIKWSGIEEWLDVQGEATVTREQVNAYLSEFGVRIETILRGEHNPVTDTTQKVDAEDANIELNFGDWETDAPVFVRLSERASDRFDEELDRRIEESWEDHADDITMPDGAQYEADVRRQMGDMFPVDDTLVEQVARNVAAAQVAGDTWQEYAGEDADLTDEDIQVEATDRAFAVLSGDEDALETEARRRAHAAIDEDRLLDELTDQERTWYYNDYESPQTQVITVDGVDGNFYHSTSYGERNLYYDGHDIRLPRNADEADVEGAIRRYVMEERLVPGGSSDSFRPTKWDDYATDKNRAVPGSYREVQLTLPVGAFGQPESKLLSKPVVTYNRYDSSNKLVGVTNSEDDAKQWATENDGRYEKVVKTTETERVSANDFVYTVHWNEKNVVGFIRFDVHIDSDGKRIMVLQEIQSDWGQQLRDGLKAQAEMARLDDLLAEKRQDVAAARKALADLLSDTAGWSDGDWRSVERLGSQGLEIPTSMTAEHVAADKLMKVSEQLRELEKKYNQAESDARDIPSPAPFVSTQKFAVFKDGKEVTRTDKNGKEVAERYGSMKDAETAAVKKGGEARDLGPQVDTPGWTALVMKRVIAHAVENGFDKVVWTNGAQQVERWKQRLRSQVDTIQWEKTEEGVHIVGMYRNRQVVDTKVKETALSSAIGKLMAKQIIADPNQRGEISGDGITIDDLGMHGYYDEIVPFTVNKLLEKLDKTARVQDIEVHPAVEYGVQDLSKQGGSGFTIVGKNGTFTTSKTFDTREAAERAVEKATNEDAADLITVQQGFEITDKLRASAANGMPLFSQRRASAEARAATARKEWYRSQLSDAVGGLPAKIKTGKDAALWLTSNAGKLGVKKDELNWSGVTDWLATQRSVTGAQIQDWLASNGVRVKDVMLGEESAEYRRLDAELDGMEEKIAVLRKAVYASGVDGRALSLVTPEDMRKAATGDTRADQKMRQLRFDQSQLDAMLAYGRALNRKNELFEQRKAAMGEPTKFNRDDLNLPGGSKYRELLLVLPRHTPEENMYAAYGAFPKDGFKTREAAQEYIDRISAVPELASEIARLPFRIEKTQTDASYRQEFRSNHYKQPNILAHVRFDERIDADGKRVLFVQEVQSDWGQKGRKEGFTGRWTTEQQARMVEARKVLEAALEKDDYLGFDDAGQARGALMRHPDYAQRWDIGPETLAAAEKYLPMQKQYMENKTGIPTAPFITDTKNWVALALKRMISHAVDNGFDRVAWTTGEQQFERYGSEEIAWVKDGAGWRVSAKDQVGGNVGGIDLEGEARARGILKEEIGTRVTTKEQLKALVSRVMPSDTNADKVTNRAWERMQTEAAGTTMPRREGMNGFYGDIMPQVARQLGATVGNSTLKTRESFNGPLLKIESDGRKYWLAESRSGNRVGSNTFASYAAADDARIATYEAEETGATPQPSFDITDKMREQAAVGMPLFSEPRKPLDQWLGRSVVRTVMYHGTARDISTFRPQQADAIFLTDDPEFAGNFADMSHSWMVNNFWTWMTPEQIQQAKRDAMRMLLQDALPGSSLYMREERLLNQSQQPSQYMRRAVEQYMPSESNIMPLYVRAENPFDYRNPEHVKAIEQEIGTSWMGHEAINGEMHEVSQHIGDLERGDWNAIESEPVQVYIRAHHDSFYVRERGVTNLAVFSPNQVKSASGNNGAYSREDNDIRQSTPRSKLTGQPINQSWTDPNITDWDDLVRKLQDNQIDTKRVLRAIRDAGIAVKEKFDAYLMETNYHGRAAARVDEFADGELRHLLEDMAMRKLSMADLDDYLWARHAPERNAANNRTNPAITDGSGMSNAQSAAILAGQAVTVGTRTIQLSAAALRAAQAVAARVDAITSNTLDLLVSSGLETKQTVDTWRNTYKHYVPLKRDMESDANYSGAFGLGNGTGTGFDVRGAASKRALGSKRAVTDVLANIAMQRERAITRSEKNRIAQAVYGLALTAPNPEFWIPVNPELNKRLSPAALAKAVAELVSIGVNPLDAQNLATEPVQRYPDPKTGLETTRINPQLRGRDDVLSTRINGEERYIFFSNKLRAQQMVRNLKNLDAAQLGDVLKWIAPVTRWFASINTQYNPIFGVTNGIRDFGTAMLNISSTGIAGHRGELAHNAFSALRGVYADLRDHRAGRTPTSRWAQLFEQFALDGGQTGYRDMFMTSADRAQAIADELEHAGKGQSWLAVGEKRSHIFGWLSDYNTAVENAMRLSAYKVALDNGMSRDAAASLAKNLTVNFNKKGLAATQTGALYAFFNAAVQGTARTAETMEKDGKLTAAGQKIIYGGLMLGVLQAALGAAAGWDDDEPPQFSREKNFILPIPGTDKIISLPMPQGFLIIPNIGRIAAEFALGGFKDPGKRLLRLANVFLDTFNPIGSGTLTQTLSPTIGDPIIALGENKDWTGKSIFKEDFNKLHPTPGWTRTKDSASTPSRWMAYAINYITGGGKYEIGMASPTPDQLDYLIGQATGGTGRELLKVAQYGAAQASGEELPMHKMPLGIGRFVGETKGQASETSHFYENLKRIGEHKSAIEEMKHAHDAQALQDYLAANPEARLVQLADKAQREVGYLRRQKRELIEKGDSKERVKLLDDRITAMTRRYNEMMRAR